MADELVSLTIDGVPVSVPKGTLVIEAAKQVGVLVPHYCYHPGLPVAGVCRMCLVDIEKAPKLQIACATQDRKSTRLNSSHVRISYAVFCLTKKPTNARY